MTNQTRTIQLNIIGDGSKATSEMDKVASKSESVAGRASKAFSGMLSGLSTGGMLGPLGEALDHVSQAFDSLAEKGKGIGKSLMGVGAAGMGAGAMLLSAASQDQQAHVQLQQAIENTGHSMDDYQSQIDGAIKQQAKFGSTSNQVQNALQTLTQATNDPQKALGMMGEAANLAAAKHESLTTASQQLAMILTGKGGKALSQFGITLDTSIKDPAARGQKAVDELAAKINGQASAAADNFGGHLRALRAEVENHIADFGQKYGPALTGASAGMTVLGGTMDAGAGILEHFRTAQEASTVATEAMTVAEGESAVTEGLALGPILLIIAAVALLGVGIYELVTHWTDVWNTIKAAISDVVGWVKDHWEAVLIGVLTGPFGLAVLFVKEHFGEIKQTVMGTIDDIITFLSQAPGKVWGIMFDFGKTLADGVIWGINQIIDAWNWLMSKFKIPGFSVGPVHFGGIDIGGGLKISEIPLLAAGGIAVSPTLAMIGESGPEAVVPLGSGAGGALGGGHDHDIVIVMDGRKVGAGVARHVRDKTIRTTGRSAPSVYTGLQVTA